jgi:hypothetical protein
MISPPVLLDDLRLRDLNLINSACHSVRFMQSQRGQMEGFNAHTIHTGVHVGACCAAPGRE